MPVTSTSSTRRPPTAHDGSSASMPRRPANVEAAEGTFSEKHGPEGRTLELVARVTLEEGQDRGSAVAVAKRFIDVLIRQDEPAYSGVVMTYLDQLGLVQFRGLPQQADRLMHELRGQTFLSPFEDRTGNTLEAMSVSPIR